MSAYCPFCDARLPARATICPVCDAQKRSRLYWLAVLIGGVIMPALAAAGLVAAYVLLMNYVYLAAAVAMILPPIFLFGEVRHGPYWFQR